MEANVLVSFSLCSQSFVDFLCVTHFVYFVYFLVRASQVWCEVSSILMAVSTQRPWQTASGKVKPCLTNAAVDCYYKGAIYSEKSIEEIPYDTSRFFLRHVSRSTFRSWAPIQRS